MLEANYPPILGFTVPADSKDLAGFITYFFAAGIALAGILAVVFLAIGGIKMIIAGDSPSKRKDATDTIKGSVLGLLLIVCAFLILNTINPFFVTPVLMPLPGLDGIFYTNGNDTKPAPMSEANTANVPKDYEKIYYKCRQGTNVFLWLFPEKNFGDYENTTVQTLKCGDTASLNKAGSFKIAFETPGVYYFLKEGCKGYMSNANLSSGQIQEPFKNKTKSVMIINNIPGDVRYDTIFHENDDTSRAGRCSFSSLSQDLNKENNCFNIGEISSSVEIFVWNAKNPEKSGTGIDFYSEPWGWSQGARAGIYKLNRDKIKNYWNDAAENLTFDYTGVSRPEKYKQAYTNFQKHPGSIKIKGNYILALTKLQGKDLYCQTFWKDINNLNMTEFVASGNKIDLITAIPIK